MSHIGLAVMTFAGAAVAAQTGTALPAPADYVTEQYGLTFRTPSGSLYCPLPADWVGSDHGTTLFLESPGKCLGAGYPSSGRSFERDGARVELFYAYQIEHDEETGPPERCTNVATVRFLGINRPVCQTTSRGRLSLSVKANYKVDTNSRAWADFTLLTTANRLSGDLKAFRMLLASVRTCTSTWTDGKKSFTTGDGPPCPDGAKWF